MNHATTMRGGALVLVVLLMLALAMFGVLSMVSADSDYKMARKSADWIADYYRLEDAGQRKLNQARAMARESGFESLSTAGWDVADATASITLAQGVQNLSVTVSLTDGGALAVSAWRQWQQGFEYPEGDGDDLWIA